MAGLVASLPGCRSVGNFHGDHSRYQMLAPGDVVHGHEWYSSELEQILALMRCIDGDEGLPGTATMIWLTQTWQDGQETALFVRCENLLKDPEGGSAEGYESNMSWGDRADG